MNEKLKSFIGKIDPNFVRGAVYNTAMLGTAVAGMVVGDVLSGGDFNARMFSGLGGGAAGAIYGSYLSDFAEGKLRNFQHKMFFDKYSGQIKEDSQEIEK